MNFLYCFSPAAAPGSGRIAATYSTLVLENVLASEKQPQDVPDSAMHQAGKHLWAQVCCSLALLCRRVSCSLEGSRFPRAGGQTLCIARDVSATVITGDCS